jgi:hypothetical protein
MADDFVLPMTRVEVVQTEETTQPEMAELVFLRGEVAPDGTILSPSRIVAIFRAVDAEGRYREDMEAVRYDITDDLDSEDPILKQRATVARGAVLFAVIPKTPTFAAAGLAGKTVRQAGIELLLSDK